MHNGRMSTSGTIALLGSGEYLNVMNELDLYLLNLRRGVSSARVVLIPTASGLEVNGPANWNALGLKHFQQLGVKEIRATSIIDRTSATDPAQLKLLEDADLYYFSGGNPQHIIDTLRDSPAWELIMRAHEGGASLAGCSAGAMMLSGYTLSLRRIMADKHVELVQALGVVPGLIVFPHFDRMAGFMEQPVFLEVLRAIPQGHTAVGIDEDTALVSIEKLETDQIAHKWRVIGRQTVKVFAADGSSQVLYQGDEVLL